MANVKPSIPCTTNGREQLDAAGHWHKLDQSELFRSYPFSGKEAHLRHWVLAYRKTDAGN